MTLARTYDLRLTTQGPLYPPSEVMNSDGDFVVIGWLNRPDGVGGVHLEWGSALVAADSPLPDFGHNLPYHIVRELPSDPAELTAADRAMVLCTLPLPLPCSNYPVVFAPAQLPDPFTITRPSYPFHAVPIVDLQPEDGPKLTTPITLSRWMQARGRLTVTLTDDATAADFTAEFDGLIPESLYTMMSIRVRDLDPADPSHPSPLGVPNVLVADRNGRAKYAARLPDPFPAPGSVRAKNRIVNVVLLWMSYQQNYGGAIGRFGLGGDVHAQLKLATPGFVEFTTRG